jgi:hypothetical protein
MDTVKGGGTVERILQLHQALNSMPNASSHILSIDSGDEVATELPDNEMTQFVYHGFDISVPAIERAITKYPDGKFSLLKSGFEEIIENNGQPDVVWCRDVILHQEKPYEFLNNIINLTKNTCVVRLRTRDKGKTDFDVENSCQLHWDKHWVPYIVLNTDEMIQKISENKDVNKIVISRSYEVLGGANYRFLPKELYFTDAKTAETAVFIQKGDRVNGEIDILFLDNQDRPKLGVLERLVRKTFSAIR